jgi:hypothetical protein
MSKSALIFIISVIWVIHQNKYFGWNLEPKSDAELLADGISFLMVALSFLAGE